MNDRPTSSIYLRIGLVSLFIRCVYFLQHMSSPFFGRPLLDQHYYDLCARQLAGAGGDLIDGFRPLLYPLFLSGFYRMDLDGGIFYAFITQHMLGIAMTLMVTWLASRLFRSAKAGIASGLLFCLSGPPLYFEGELLITTLFSFLLLLFWMLLFLAGESSSRRQAIIRWLVAGMVLGHAAQARPNAIPLLLLFPVISLYRAFSVRSRADAAVPTQEPTKKKRSSKPEIVLPLLALVGVLGVQTLFGFLNARYSGRFSLMTQAGGINLYLGNAQNADGMIPRQSRHVVYEGEYRDPIQVMAEDGFRAATGTAGPVSQKEVSAFWKDQTIDEIRADPARWAHLMLKKSWLMLWNHEVPNNRSYAFAAQQETSLLRWLPVRWWLLLILFPGGIAALYKRGQRELLLWVLGYFALFSATVVLFFVNSRFRIPLWPGMAIVAGGGALYAWECAKSRTLPLRSALAGATLLLLSSINWFGIPPDPVESDLYMRAVAYYEQGRLDEALPDIRQCLEFAPDNPRYHFMHGNLLMAAGNSTDAIRAFQAAISLDPSDPAFYCNLGVALENCNQLPESERAYHNAIQVQPNYKAAKINLMLLLIRQEKSDEAHRLLAPLLLQEPQNPLLLCSEAILRFKQSHDPEALKLANALNPALAQHLLETHESVED